MRRFQTRILSTVSFAALAVVGLPAAAFAQEGAADLDECASLPTEAERTQCAATRTGDAATIAPEAASPATRDEPIVITGSRLRRSEFNTPDPVTIINPDLALQEGDTETAEVLQQSPVAAGSVQITSVISSNFVANGGFGVQSVDLRGLGAERTLTLLNGRRAGPAGVRGAVSSFDLNVLPLSVISSIEILKTGASSIYGSDAIAGVVNIITKRDTDGIELRGSSSIPLESGGETYSISATYGRDFGRGHFLVSADYYRRNEIARGDRDFLGCTEEYLLRGEERADLLDPRTGQPSCGGSIGGVVFLSDFSGFFTGAPTNLQVNGRGFILAAYDYPGSRYGEFLPPIPARNSVFQLRATPEFRAANFDGPSTGILAEPTQLLTDSVYPRTERFSLYTQGGYELTPNIELFFEGLYNNRQTYINSTGFLFPTQFTGDTFLPYYFCDGDLSDDQPGPAGGTIDCDPFSSGDPFNTELGGQVLITPQFTHPFQDFWQNVDYYRGVVGGRGSFGDWLDGWTWEASAQYSRSDGSYSNNFVFRDAYETLDYRTEACAGTVTSVRGVPCLDIDLTNPQIMQGIFTPEQQTFLFGEETGNTLYQQLTGEFSATGTVFTLPAGDVAVALGVQWRRDSIRDVPGESTLAGNVQGLTGAGITAGFSRTSEAFAEIQIPLIHDTPFIQELSITGAARITNVYAERDSDGFSDSNNGNITYRVAANWRVNDWLRFRGSYGTSFRAPALFEQFLANETGFFAQGAGIDPCTNLATRLTQGTVSQRVYDNCIAAGVPTNYTGAGRSGGISISQGGIGQLEPETSDALSVGVVVTTPLWRGSRFSFTADYFDIDVRGQIARLGAANIVLGCYNSEFFPTDPLCDQFTRVNNPADPNDDAITEVRNPFLNINRQRNRGLDFTARLVQEIGNWGTVAVQGQVNYQLEDEFTLFFGTTTSSNGEAGDPRFIGDFNVTWTNEPVTIVYGLDVIGKTSDVEDLIDAQGAECRTSVFRPGGEFCIDARLGTTYYHSLSATIAVTRDFDFTVGVANLFDTRPPRFSTVFGTISNLGQAPVFGTQYDYFGRRVFAHVRARF